MTTSLDESERQLAIARKALQDISKTLADCRTLPDKTAPVCRAAWRAYGALLEMEDAD